MEKEKRCVRMRTKKELKKLAEDIFDGKVFGTWDIKGEENLIPMVFFVAAFAPEKIPKDTAHLFEYMENALPRCVNGKPMFMSCRILTKKELPLVMKNLEILRKLREQYRSG